MHPHTLGTLLADNARHLPHHVATVAGRRQATYLAHFENAQRIASALARLGVRRQDRIAILSRNSIEYIDIFGAAQLAGFIATTVNFRLVAAEISHVLQDSGAVVVFFEQEYADAIAGVRAALPALRHAVCIGQAPAWALGYEDLRQSGSLDGAPFRALPDDTIHLIYTSGTTGRPKGVARSQRAEMEVADVMTTEVGVLRHDVVQLMMPLFHVGARFLQLAAHRRGAKVVLHREFQEEEILDAIAVHRVSVTHMAPVMVQRLLEHPRLDAFDLGSLKTVYYTAAPMPLPVLQSGLARLGPVFVQLYGMTEGLGTTLHKDQHRPQGGERERARLSSVGQCPPGIRIRIVDDAGQDVLPGIPGEVLTETTTRMQGYWNNTTATLDAVRDGWYHTGDMGYLDDENFLFLVDRKKDMIISGGENIYCREVEEAIASHDDVLEVAVIGRPDPRWGESVCAIVVLKPGRGATAEHIVSHCGSRIARYKRPKTVVFAEALPRLNTGKIDKNALRKSAAANA
jgi:acyl-CoA synthetase (AMP-forming)/AMP-acid ligase II